MIFLVIVSILLLVYNSTNQSERFQYLEDLILTVFISEYILRVWIYGDIHKIVIQHYKMSQFLQRKISLLTIARDSFKMKWEYMSTPLAVIDLLAILPDFRALRFLRIFLVFRLFKLFRYTKSINKFLTVLDDKKFELFALFILFGFVILLSSVAMYIFEVKDNSNIETIFDSIYWSYVTIASLGYGDISPISSEGRVVTLFLILSGIAFISFATSIITSAFNEKIIEIKQDKLKNRIDRLEDNTLIFGYSSIAIKLYRQLIDSGHSATVVCEKLEESEEALRDKIMAIHGDFGDSHFLLSIGIQKNTSRVVCLTDSESKNLNIALSIRTLNRDIEIVSIIENEKSRRKFNLAGVDRVLYPYSIFSRMVMTYIKYPNVFKSMEAIVFADSNILVEEVVVKKGEFLHNRLIGEVEFRRFKMILFGVLRGDEFFFKPDRLFKLRENDTLIIFGDRVSLKYLR
jgi:voltage-gated potassium channel